jgi:hypothetical protein
MEVMIVDMIMETKKKGDMVMITEDTTMEVTTMEGMIMEVTIMEATTMAHMKKILILMQQSFTLLEICFNQ